MIGTNLDLTVKAVNVTDVEKVEDRRDIKF
jgi:hypothetical protein